MTLQLGNIAAGSTLAFMFPTTNAVGASVAATTAGTVKVYRDDGAAESEVGITYTPSFDGVDGQNLVKIVTTDGFYAAGHDYQVVLQGMVLPGIRGYAPPTVNTVLAVFSIENRLEATVIEVTTEGTIIQSSN